MVSGKIFIKLLFFPDFSCNARVYVRVDATLLIISMLCDGISFHFLIRTETRVCPAWHQKIVLL